MRLFLLAVLLMRGCARLGFEAQAATDAGKTTPPVDASDVSDIDAAPPVASGPFEAPVLVGSLSHASFDDDDPSLTADMLEVYFKRDPNQGTKSDVFFSTRTSVNNA